MFYNFVGFYIQNCCEKNPKNARGRCRCSKLTSPTVFLGTILSTCPMLSLTFQSKWPVWKNLLVYFWSDWFGMRLCAFHERRPRDKWVKCQFSQNNNSSKFMKEHLNFKGHDLSSILNAKKQVIWHVVSSRLPLENTISENIRSRIFSPSAKNSPIQICLYSILEVHSPTPG